MKTLVLIDNNLEHDNRVKRHVTTMLNLGHQVKVIAVPVPSATPGLVREGLEVIFWPHPEITLQVAKLRELARATLLTGFVFRSFPAALTPLESFPRLSELSRRIQERQLECSWWASFRPAVCKEDVDPLDDHRMLVFSYEYMLSWALFVRQHPADLVYCNDLPSLLAGVAHKLCFGSRLIYDAHEIYCDIVPGAHSRAWKQSMALLEQGLSGVPDCIIGVSESHAEWMRKTYCLARQVVCVPNCFGMGQEVPPPPPRTPADPLRIYYHGASDAWRGLSKLVRGIAFVPGVKLVLRCPPSPSLEEARQLAQALDVSERVQILPLVPPDRMIDAIRAEADVGIHACEPPTALNIKVGLSNKFIEYLMAGIPVVTAPLEEQARLVRQYDLGVVLRDNSPGEIACALKWLKANVARLPEMGRRSYQAGVRHFSWRSIRCTLERALTENQGHDGKRNHPRCLPGLDGVQLGAA